MDPNLRPIKPGQVGRDHPAKKPLSQHRTKVIAVRVTADELKTVTINAKEAGLSISKLGRKLFGLD